MKDELKIAVLMGGPSEEHEISLRSGQGVVEALQRRHWSAQPLVIPQTLAIPEACEFVRQALKRLGAEVAFLALHGTFGEDGTIQQLCEDLHLAYTGSDAAASRLGMNKVASRRRFEAAGLSVPRWRAVTLADGPASRQLNGVSYPLVVKPVSQGSSLGVSVVQRPTALPEAIAAASRYGAQVIIEEWVAGRELTVGVLGETPLPVIEIRPHEGFFDYAAKYTPGSTDYLVPAPLDDDVTRRVQAIGVAAHRALGCRHLSRADLILTPDNVPVLLEVNTIPGFTQTSLLPKAAECVKISYDELCEQLVMMACASTHLLEGSACQGAPHLARITHGA